MKIFYNKIRLLILLPMLFVGIFMNNSCVDDMDVQPLDDDIFTIEEFFQQPGAYKQFLAKLYAGFALSGQQGPAGNGDISGIDEGFGQYLRGYWQLQELSTDEAVIAWGDGNLPSLNTNTWNANNEFIYATFSRTMYQVSLSNEFLRQTTDAKLNDRGVDAATKAEIQIYRAEARFIRALAYYHAMDLYGNIPFTTENDIVGYFLPPQKDRAFVFSYIESELLDAANTLVAPKTNEYGRVDKAAAWMLLAKMYLNAAVYTGTARYSDALIYATKVIDTPYVIANVPYKYLFMADNGTNGAQNEFIYPVLFDGLNTKTWGGTTYLVHAAIGGSMSAGDFGVNGGWQGLRAKPEFIANFPDISGATDTRAMFHTAGQNLSVNNIGTFTDGYAVKKWSNKKSNGTNGSDNTGDHVDTDFPMLRLADAYLTYVEAHLNGGGGSATTALGYINTLRTRAGASSLASVNMNVLKQERTREMYWEATRRTDLIRWGDYTAGTGWQWRGGTLAGTTLGDHLKLYPIPEKAMQANPSLIQNTGY